MYYFDDIEKQRELKIILDEWKGTPFRHHCGVKGLGCDCIHFVAHVFSEMGLLMITKKTIPDYPKDWHLHNTRELLEEGILRHPKMKKVTPSNFMSEDAISNFMNGDIVGSHFGQAASHAGVFFDGCVYQALNGIGVRKINFSDKKFRPRMKFVYRILK